MTPPDAAPPRLGDLSTCRSCRAPIEFIGPYWRHIGKDPRHPADPPPPPGPAAVPPDVLARAVAALIENRHDGTGNWNIDQNGEVYGRGRHRHCPHRMSPLSAVAVAVYCYGLDDPAMTDERIDTLIDRMGEVAESYSGSAEHPPDDRLDYRLPSGKRSAAEFRVVVRRWLSGMPGPREKGADR
jgi:hypothetical protein